MQPANPPGSFDYIVIGGGTAGCVVASRLSENQNVSVLIIEAGGTNSQLMVNTPAAQQHLQVSELDWHFSTTMQPILKNRTIFWPRGKVLGGCSSINAMCYVRGQKANYNKFWPKSWSYDSVLPFFMKSEAFVKDIETGVKQKTADNDAVQKLRGMKGPLCVRDLAYEPDSNVWSRRFVQAAVEAGFESNSDYNGIHQSGVAMVQSMINNGKRHSTAHAFLDDTDAKTRTNLTIWHHSHVTKIITQGNEVLGVLVRAMNPDLSSLSSSEQLQSLELVRDQFVPVRREVILCAGAINSPWILQNSGMGPRQHLSDMGIPPVADLAVGENLQDHLVTPVLFEVKGNSTLDSVRRPGLFQLLAFGKYLLTTKGPVRSPLLEATAFYRTGLDASHDQNDAQILFIPALLDVDLTYRLFNNRVLFAGQWDNFPQFGIAMVCCHLLPESSGYVRVVSRNPLECPVIEPNYLCTELDMAVHVDLVKKARTIAASPSWADLIVGEITDKNILHEPSSDEYIREYIKRSASTIYHPIGTCKMGEESETNAVVDPRLRVKSIKRLRVADASVMPKLISGNTCAPVIMIAEKAAYMIAEDYENDREA